MSDISDVSGVSGQTGTLVMDLQGKVLSATGEMERPDLPDTIFNMLQDTNAILAASGKSNDFRKLSVHFDSCQFAIAIAASKIYAVKTQG
mmetsp:Transcript_26021/g.59974  ORF Transcript_26021/g.59974 Transcript_26021/m.59974 type:complete len:90 (-) Transcript_26021:64-333(-)